MDALADAYDQALLNVIKGWESEWDPYMGVIWQPGSGIDLGQWPEEALSGVDCFHPSWEAHRRVAGGFWNRMVGDLVSLKLRRPNFCLPSLVPDAAILNLDGVMCVRILG